MACLTTKRVCARGIVQEKLLCQFLSKRNNFHQQPHQQELLLLHQKHKQPTHNAQSINVNRSNSGRSINLQRYLFTISNADACSNSTYQRRPIMMNGSGFGAKFIRSLSDSSVAASNAAATSAAINPTTSPNATIANQLKHMTVTRDFSSVHTQQPVAGAKHDYQIQVDPYLLLEDELKYIYQDMRQLLENGTNQPELDTISKYYFTGEGKALRPMVCLLMAKAVNYHMQIESPELMEKQRQVALISEMTHSSSLIHDDVIDQSDFRRGRPSVNVIWNHRRVTMAGDYIIAVTSILIARLRNSDVTITLNQILSDLIQGELMQLGSKETENERFAHYLMKTFRKTASLIANTCKAVAQLSGADERTIELTYQYGRNVGLAFQFVDDLLDFVSTAETLGKPAAADLKLGLATAPVLFACEKYPELNPMIMRRFQEKGDVEKAFELVHKSQGLDQTRFLARKHCIEAIRLAQELAESPYQKGLQVVSDLVLNRLK